MKKSILYYCLIAITSSSMFLSCQKNEVQNTSDKKNKFQTITAILPVTTDPGQYHNNIINEYESRWGIEYSEYHVTVSEVVTIFERVYQIAQDNGDFSDTANVHNYAVLEVNDLIAEGFFDNTIGYLKGNMDLNEIMANNVSNTSIRAVFLNINNYESDEGFLSYASEQLNTLTGLSQTEQENIDGYSSVLNSSFNLWKGKAAPAQLLEYTKVVAQADAQGFDEGFRAAIKEGYWLIAEPYAKYHAAAVSLAAAKNFKWE